MLSIFGIGRELSQPHWLFTACHPRRNKFFYKLNQGSWTFIIDQDGQRKSAGQGSWGYSKEDGRSSKYNPSLRLRYFLSFEKDGPLTTFIITEKIQLNVWKRDAAWEGEGCSKNEREAGCRYVFRNPSPLEYILTSVQPMRRRPLKPLLGRRNRWDRDILPKTPTIRMMGNVNLYDGVFGLGYTWKSIWSMGSGGRCLECVALRIDNLQVSKLFLLLQYCECYVARILCMRNRNGK